MTLWLTLTALMAASAALVTMPLGRRRAGVQVTAGDRALAIARDQLAELERERAAGAIDEAEADQARAEIERRVLAVARAPAQAGPRRTDRAAVIAMVTVPGWVAVGAALLYSTVGRPDLPAAPFRAAPQVASQAPPTATAGTARPAAPEPGAAGGTPPGTVSELIANLEARLAQNPGDAEGWRMLAWSYFNTENYTGAVEAYAKSVALDATDSDVWSAYGESLVRAGDGLVSPESIAAFDAALQINPDDPRARFFKGMALEQAGDAAGAIAAWQAILDSAPPGADWAEGVRQRIEELAAQSGIAPAQLPAGALLPPTVATAPPAPAPAAPGPTAEDIRAAGQMSAQDRQAMIRSMVERLADRLRDEPGDLDGWIRLMRARMVLGETDAAQAALGAALDHFGGDAAAADRLRAAARDLGMAVR